VKIQLSKLSNGIRVVSCEMPHVQSVTLGIWTSVGGRYEPRRLNGISHFIEHMLFKGTKRRTARKIGQEIESVGGYLNATTTHDHTVYFGAAPADHLRRLSAVLCDMYLSPRFSESDIRKERSVIVEEILMYLDEPSDWVQELLWEELWPDHALGRPLTGSIASIEGIARADFLRFRERHYHGANTVISAAGQLHHEAVVERVDALLGSLPRGRRSMAPPAPERKVRAHIRIERKDTQQVHVAFGLPSCNLHDERRYATGLLNVIMAGNMSSRLFQELREKRGLCYNVSSNVSHYEDTGVINFYLGLDARNVAKSLGLIAREFERLRERPIPLAELRRAKEYAIGATRMSLERTSAQNSRIGYSTMFYGGVVDVDESQEKTRQVTSEDVQRAAREVLRLDRVTMAVVGPVEDEAAIREALA
jgi:predicted Zn-dependent peptidase